VRLLPSFRDGGREPAFDEAQSDGEVGIIRRQRHNHMDVIGKYDNRVNGEGCCRRVSLSAMRKSAT
jgi:hypothetical protein